MTKIKSTGGASGSSSSSERKSVSSEGSLGKDGRSRADKVVVTELQELYQDKLLPIELSSLFHK